MVAPSEQLNLEIVAHDQSGNPREAIWNVQDEDVPMEVIVESHMTVIWHSYMEISFLSTHRYGVSVSVIA